MAEKAQFNTALWMATSGASMEVIENMLGPLDRSQAWTEAERQQVLDAMQQQTPSTGNGLANYVFVRNGSSSNAWLRYAEHSLADSNRSPAIVPRSGKVYAVAVNNTDQEAEFRIELYVNDIASLRFDVFGSDLHFPSEQLEVQQGDRLAVRIIRTGESFDDPHVTISLEF